MRRSSPPPERSESKGKAKGGKGKFPGKGWSKHKKGKHPGKWKDRPPGPPTSQHIIIQAVTLNGKFGQLLDMSLRPTREDGQKVRNLMPLPFWPDARDALEEVIQTLKFKDEPGDWRSRGDTGAEARLEELPQEPQENALLNIWDMVKVFVDEKIPKSGVPRTPKGRMGRIREAERLLLR